MPSFGVSPRRKNFPLINFYIQSPRRFYDDPWMDVSLKRKIRWNSHVVAYFPFLRIHCSRSRPTEQRKVMELNCVVFISLLMKLKVPRLASFFPSSMAQTIHKCTEPLKFYVHGSCEAGVGFMGPLNERENKLLQATGKRLELPLMRDFFYGIYVHGRSNICRRSTKLYKVPGK